MSRFLVSALFLALLLGLAGLSAGQAPEAKGPLAVGKNLPGPFHAYNATGASKGRYHCLVSEFDADPVVLLFARGLEDHKVFKDLLQQIEAAIQRNPAARLRCFVVFLNPDLASPREDDDKRDKLAKDLENLSAELKLNKVVLCLAGKADLEKYKLEEDTALTALLYRKLEILAAHPTSRDRIDDALVKQILGELASKLGAAR